MLEQDDSGADSVEHVAGAFSTGVKLLKGGVQRLPFFGEIEDGVDAIVGGDDGNFAIFAGHIGYRTGDFADFDESGFGEIAGLNNHDHGHFLIVGSPRFHGHFAFLAIVEQGEVFGTEIPDALASFGGDGHRHNDET